MLSFAVRSRVLVKICLTNGTYSDTLMFETSRFFLALYQGRYKVHGIGHQMDGRDQRGGIRD